MKNPLWPEARQKSIYYPFLGDQLYEQPLSLLLQKQPKWAIIIIIIIIIIKKRPAVQGWERVIYTLSVRRPQPHKPNLKTERREMEN